MDTSALKAIQSRTLLESWEDAVDGEQLEKTRALLNELLSDLIALGDDAAQEDVEDRLEQCVEALNDLDGEQQFISTIEREDLSELLFEIGDHCGMPDDEDWVEEWRDW